MWEEESSGSALGSDSLNGHSLCDSIRVEMLEIRNSKCGVLFSVDRRVFVDDYSKTSPWK